MNRNEEGWANATYHLLSTPCKILEGICNFGFGEMGIVDDDDRCRVSGVQEVILLA